MDENPYAPPNAPSEGNEPAAPTAGLPWEQPGPWGPRAWATVRLILHSPPEAGARLGARKALGPAVAFAALVGLPFKLIEQVLVVLWTPLDGGIQAALMRKMGLPLPPPPTGEQLEAAGNLHQIQAVLAVALSPIFLAIGILLFGLMAHVGLWMFRGLEEKRGLEVTYRSLLFVGAATAWAWCFAPFGLLLPESLQMIYLVASTGLTFGLLSYQGLVLAHAHGVKPWQGICAVLVPFLGIFCCLSICAAAAIMASKAG